MSAEAGLAAKAGGARADAARARARWSWPSRAASTAPTSRSSPTACSATRALAVTADSESLAEEQRELALGLARRFGFAHRVIRTPEFEDPLYVQERRRPLLPLQVGALPAAAAARRGARASPTWPMA